MRLNSIAQQRDIGSSCKGKAPRIISSSFNSDDGENRVNRGGSNIGGGNENSEDTNGDNGAGGGIVSSGVVNGGYVNQVGMITNPSITRFMSTSKHWFYDQDLS